MHAFRSILSRHTSAALTSAALLMMALLMIWISCAPTLVFFSGEACASAHADDGDEDQHDSVEVTQLNEAVIPAYKIDMVFFVSFIQELGLLEEVPEVRILDTPLPRGTYLQTLFRRIISPNAP